MKSRHIAIVAIRLLALYLIVLNLCDVLGTLMLSASRNHGTNNAFPTVSLLTLGLGLIMWMIAPWLARNTIKDSEEEAVKIDMAQFVACAIAGIFLWVMASNIGNVAYYVAQQFSGDSNKNAVGSLYGFSSHSYQVFTTFFVSFLMVILAPWLGIAFENIFSDVRKHNDA